MESKTLTGKDAELARQWVPKILDALLLEGGTSLAPGVELTVGNILPPIVMADRLVFRFGPASISTSHQIALDAFQGRSAVILGQTLRFAGAWPMTQRLRSGVRFRWEVPPKCEDYWGILDVRIESVDLFYDRAVTNVSTRLGDRQLEVRWPE
jgi:hypothetical protein